ncbi:MAG TPA: hypothetical protein HPP80_02960 [Rhodospirillaceae bacterium]|nr:hypothetical protein [Rhodospirillaceae bacterium]
MAVKSLLGRFLTAGLAVGICLSSPVTAREIHLGGQTADPKILKQPNTVVLPPIVLALPRDDGGWHHIRIDAWLTPSDEKTTAALEGIRTTIVKNASQDLPEAKFEDLRSARLGMKLAKQIIHDAAEEGLGRPWTGEVMIKTMLAY